MKDVRGRGRRNSVRRSRVSSVLRKVWGERVVRWRRRWRRRWRWEREGWRGLVVADVGGFVLEGVAGEGLEVVDGVLVVVVVAWSSSSSSSALRSLEELAWRLGRAVVERDRRIEEVSRLRSSSDGLSR